MTTPPTLQQQAEAAAKPLPCPFCGEQPVIKQAGKTNYWWIGCEIHICHEDKGCGVSCSDYDKEQAIKKWNTRKHLAPMEAQLVEAKKENERIKSLEGYRAMGQQIATALEERDEARREVEKFNQSANSWHEVLEMIPSPVEEKTDGELVKDYILKLTTDNQQLRARVASLEKCLSDFVDTVPDDHIHGEECSQEQCWICNAKEILNENQARK